MMGIVKNGGAMIYVHNKFLDKRCFLDGSRALCLILSHPTNSILEASSITYNYPVLGYCGSIIPNSYQKMETN